MGEGSASAMDDSLRQRLEEHSTCTRPRLRSSLTCPLPCGVLRHFRPSRLTKLPSALPCCYTDIDGLINIVPPKFYFPPDADEMARKFLKYTGKVQKAPKHERKLAKVERKRAALDPEQPNTTEALAAGDGDDDDDDSNDDDDDDDDSDDDEEEEETPRKKGKGAGKQQQQQQKQKQPPPQKPPAQSADGAAGASSADAAPKPPMPMLNAAGRLEGTLDCGLSVDGLRQRLAERLKQLRGKRGGTVKGPGERQADAKAKAKQKKHVAGGQNKKQLAAAGGSGGDGGGGNGASGGDSSGSAAASRGGAQSIEFNKLAAAAAQPSKANKRKMSTAELLAHAEEAERKKRNRLAQPDGGGEDAQIGEWQRALQKAGGIKQKDNPTLLRKALKRQQRTKKKSAKEWVSRLKTVAKTMSEKQERRKTNLADRKTKNKTKAAKHKAARAGFEGKKNSFLS
jgi:hypothetical protein